MDQKVVPRGSALGKTDYSKTGHKPIFYGWVMVVVSFVAQGVGFGNQYFTGLFIQPFKETFHASSTAVLFATSGALSLALGIGFPLCGMIASRYSIRKLLLAGIGSIGVGYLLLAYAQHIWHVAVVYGLFFAAGALSCSVGGQTLVSNWFVAKRGFALGISVTGVSVAGLVVTPLATLAIGELGWQTTSLVAAAVFFALAPLVSWLVVEKPEDKGQWPDGSDAPTAEAAWSSGDPNSDWTLKRVLLTPRFWVIAICCGVGMGTSMVILANLMPLAEHANIDRQLGAYLISCAAASAVLANIAFGALFDSSSQRMIVTTAFLLVAGSCVMLLFMHSGYWVLFIASALVGASSAAGTLMPGVLAGINFGRHAFALAFGAIGQITIVFSLACLFLFGRAIDLYGTYQPVLVGFLIVFGLMLVVAWLALPAGRKGL